MYGSQSTYACHTFVSYFNLLIYFFQMSTIPRDSVWPAALKLGCVNNFDILSLVIGFISLVDEIQFMRISSRHILHRSIRYLFL